MRLELSIRIGLCFWGKATYRTFFVFWILYSGLPFFTGNFFFDVSGIIAGGGKVTAHKTEANVITFDVECVLECMVVKERVKIISPESGEANHYRSNNNGG